MDLGVVIVGLESEGHGQDQKSSDQYLQNHLQYMLTSNHLVTFFIALSYLIGFLSFSHNSLLLLYLLIVALPFFKTISRLTPIELAKISLTGLIMGYLNSWSVDNIQNWLSGVESGVPTTSIYCLIMTVYHNGQFQMVNNFHHEEVQWKSFLIYHSVGYTAANICMFTQHLLTKYYFEFAYKNHHFLMFPALIVGIVGLLFRISAQFTCQKNFTHIVQEKKREGHVLVTHGIYKYFRHPSYTGYYYFTVFIQLFLANILSTLAFAFVLTRFFNSRIKGQERNLRSFFPNYKEYSLRTHIYIPFVTEHPLSHQD